MGPFNQAFPYDAAMASVTALVAHQGGWDEVLLVAGPVVVIVVALTLAKRRVDRLEQAGSGVAGDAEERGSGSRCRK